MTIRVCDRCEHEIKKYYKVHLSYTLIYSNGEDSEKQTPYLELCEDCLHDVLEELGLDKE
jgi:hypothetical protein